MGMSRVFSKEEEEEFKKDVSKMERFEKFIHYLTDICFGFFVFPFLYFIVTNTVNLVETPTSLNDGVAILYIALITGIFYLLRQETIVVLETKRINVIFMLFGLSIFLLAFTLLKLPHLLESVCSCTQIN